MKDTKSLTLLLLSSVLFLLSIILLCTWGYQYYHQIQEDKNKMQQLAVKPSSAVADDTRDSLLKIYQVTLNSLGNNADTAYNAADSLKAFIGSSEEAARGDEAATGSAGVRIVCGSAVSSAGL